MAKFGIHKVLRGGAGTTLHGRCYQGPIHVGGLFHRLYLASAEDPIAAEREVRVRVDAIRAYGRSLESLDEGLSAELTVSGEHSDDLREMWILAGEDDD